MKRIGKTDGGGILVEFTSGDVVRLMGACQSLDQLFGEIDMCVEPACGTGAFIGDAVRNAVYTTPPAVVKAVKKAVKTDTTAQKPCEQCGELFTPPRKDSRFCSKACRMTAYRAGKAKAGIVTKRAPKASTKPELPSTFCLACKKSFVPHRKDQTCCSKACRAKVPRSTYPKYDAEAAKAARLAALKELDVKKRGTFKPRCLWMPGRSYLRCLSILTMAKGLRTLLAIPIDRKRPPLFTTTQGLPFSRLS
jgi:hypothetical protein